jgi:CLIP-associating protein 1/2
MRSATTKSQSPERASRLESMDLDPVQVYEDPFVGDEPATTRAGPVKPVLEEIPINERVSDIESREGFTSELGQSARSNEQNSVQNTPRGHHKTTSTGSILGKGEDSGIMPVNSEVLRSRRLLVSGIERIRAKTLDAHGFRRVQDIVKGNQDIWGENSQRYGELLLALLDYLEAPADALRTAGTAATKIQNLKTQVLATMRAMLAIHKKEAEPYYSRALCSVLAARSQFDEMSHITAEMERAILEIVRAGNPSDSLNAVLDLVDSLLPPPSPSKPNPVQTAPTSQPSPPPLGPKTHAARTITTSLSTLAALLGAGQARSVAVSAAQTKRLGGLAVRLLQDENPEVRRADLEFCLELHEKLGGENGEGFWKAVAGAREHNLNLITYYLARRGKA